MEKWFKNLILAGLILGVFVGCGVAPIHTAISTKNNQQLKTLIESGEDIEVEYMSGLPWTPLQHAVSTANTEAVKLLLDKNVSLNKKYYGNNVLFTAVASGNEEMVKLLLTKPFDLRQKNDSGEPILFSAARTGKLSLMKYLIDKGADLHATNAEGISVIFPASSSGSVPLLEYLLSQGFSINEKTKNGITPIFNMVAAGRVDALKFAIAKGADVHQRNKDNWTVLFNVPTVIAQSAFYVQEWAHLSYMAEHVKIHKTEIENSIACWKVLIDAKVDPNVVDVYNKKALDYLAKYPQYATTLLTYYETKAKLIAEQDRNTKIMNEINGYLSREDFEGLKSLTEKNPNYVNYIANNTLRLMLTGPKGMKVGDILKMLKDKKSEILIVSLIKRVQVPYKEFSLEEIDDLLKMGLTDKTVAAMIDVTTELLKDEKKKKEQEFYLAEQKRVAEQKGDSKVIYQTINNTNNTQDNALSNAVQNKLIEKGADLLFKSLFR